jgi:hypothetical protein
MWDKTLADENATGSMMGPPLGSSNADRPRRRLLEPTSVPRDLRLNLRTLLTPGAPDLLQTDFGNDQIRSDLVVDHGSSKEQSRRWGVRIMRLDGGSRQHEPRYERSTNTMLEGLPTGTWWPVNERPPVA